ncbi:MAG: N-acetylmuramoyl-L-alanine amidase [Chlamydiia bacterium]|nr:N-acetylmuramoyl-L-alanine amidase [Chlamydiia bacterium]
MLKLILLFICFNFPLMLSCSQGENGDFIAAATPQKTQKKELIVIDPGHGGFDIGATVQSVEEKALALQTATLVKQYLHDKGYRVILTRSRDVFVSLKKRTSIANDTKSKLFVSIHFNAFKGTDVKGIEIYYYNKGDKGRQTASKKLAQLVLNGLIAATGTPSRGVKTGNFHVIRETNMPAILIEGGFITNPQERTHLKDKKYVEKMAQSIADAIEKYFRS